MGDEHRFYIDCYGICDSWRKGSNCDETKLSWQELCDLLNSLYENVDTDKQRLLLKIDELEKENKKLNYDLDRIYGKIGEILNDREL